MIKIVGWVQRSETQHNRSRSLGRMRSQSPNTKINSQVLGYAHLSFQIISTKSLALLALIELQYLPRFTQPTFYFNY